VAAVHKALGLAVFLLASKQFKGRLEMGGELTPLLGIEVVHQSHQLGMLESLVPKELPYVSPVLLLAMRVVVLAVGAAARPGQVSRPPCQMPVQCPVEELPAVIGMKGLRVWLINSFPGLR